MRAAGRLSWTSDGIVRVSALAPSDFGMTQKAQVRLQPSAIFTGRIARANQRFWRGVVIQVEIGVVCPYESGSEERVLHPPPG